MGKKIEDIEKVLYPDSNTLKADMDGTLKGTVIDAEMDDIECTFNNDNCVEIDSDKYTYLTLSKSNLQQLLKMIKEAEKMYKSMEKMDKSMD